MGVIVYELMQSDFKSSILLCEEMASGNESYQIEIKKTNCWEMGQKY